MEDDEKNISHKENHFFSFLSRCLFIIFEMLALLQQSLANIPTIQFLGGSCGENLAKGAGFSAYGVLNELATLVN